MDLAMPQSKVLAENPIPSRNACVPGWVFGAPKCQKRHPTIANSSTSKILSLPKLTQDDLLVIKSILVQTATLQNVFDIRAA
jgi:hypothetical protein